MFRGLRHKGQSSLETTVFIIVVIAALLAMQSYLKRGLQGRMRSSSDGIGEQYDPMTTEGDITQTLSGRMITTITVQNASGGGKKTLRDDVSNMTESKSGFTRVDSYK